MTNFSWRQAVLTMVAVFVTGAAAGAFTMSLYMAKTVTAARPNTPQQWRQDYVGKLKARLTLNDAQVGRLNGILDEAKQRMDAVKARSKPEMDRIYIDQVSNIRAMLEPTQQAEYDRYREERDRERKKKQQEQQQQSQAATAAK
jgi:hypothetical protein